MLAAGIAMLVGATVACFPPFPVSSDWIFLLPIALLLALTKQRGRFFWLVLCAMLWTSLHTHLQLRQNLPSGLHNKELMVQGEVVGLPRYGTHSIRFLLAVDAGHSVVGTPALIRLSWREPEQVLRPGQVWRFAVRLKPAHGYQNPGGFDFERWLLVQGIRATGYVRSSQPAELLHPGGWSIDRWRAQINRRIERLCGECQHVGLIKALTTGYRGGLSQSTRELLQQTGSAHLIAVSGLHIGIVAGLFYLLARVAWRFGGARWINDLDDFALLVAASAALIYALLSGFALPAQRAMVMLLVVAMVRLLRWPFSLLSAVALSLVVVLLIDPLAVLAASFWLTFGALAIILLATFLLPATANWWRRLFGIQVLFSLLLVPLTLVVFNQLHSASLLANLVAVPLVSVLIVPCNFLLLALFWLPDRWLQLLYKVLDYALDFLLDYLELLTNMGLAAIDVATPGPWLVLLLLLWLTLLVIPRHMRLLSGGLWLLPLVVLAHALPRQRPPLSVTVLDVGMGTAVVVETRRHVLVYDFGPGNLEGYSLGQWVVEPYLRHRGVHSVDRLVISHADQDHMGGMFALAEDYRDAWVVSGTPDLLRQKMPTLQRISSCHDLGPWRWDGVEFEFLTGINPPGASKNNRSCVLSIRLGQRHILLPGDIETSQEYQLLARYQGKLAADVLVTPHHGSMTSSSPAFVRAVRPHYVIHTVGLYNRWGFPRPAVLRRYQAVAARQFRTDRDGAVLVECDAQHCEVVSRRRQNPRFWY